ncbi:hypothetical protein SCP_0804270 [Sparassis crispa]|uniref:Uncharacterized protein n=1 Tax=Sparassis crispa TaxID=139825 RepID=A0A401GUN8_9APHY|nr:hypothetical protein SCP_0804270 [Sparassis crispa]GBE85903.1 hypothetical protein SCP_0804270 [Sparassis crispa]
MGFVIVYEEVTRVFESSKEPDDIIANASYIKRIRLVGVSDSAPSWPACKHRRALGDNANNGV